MAMMQNDGLIGSRGLLPGNKHLKMIEQHAGTDIWKKLSYAPTLFWAFDYDE